jgi:hypothetical protein
MPPWRRRSHDKAGATPSYEARFRNAAQHRNQRLAGLRPKLKQIELNPRSKSARGYLRPSPLP